MTNTELTHSYQHLAAQADLDKEWMKKVEAAITDHATWLDRHERGNQGVRPELAFHRETVMREVEARIGELQPPPAVSPSADGELRAHVRAQDAAMGERLASVEQALRQAIAATDTELRLHAQEAVHTLAERVHVLEAHRGMTTSPTSPNAGGALGGLSPSYETNLSLSSLKLRVGDLETRVSEVSHAAAAKANAVEAAATDALCTAVQRLDAHHGASTAALSAATQAWGPRSSRARRS